MREWPDGGRHRAGGLRRAGGPRCLLALGLACLAVPAFGQGTITDLLLFRTRDSLRAEVRAQNLLNKRTTTTIESGLPGSCVYLLRLQDRSGRPVAERYVEWNLRYDMWLGGYLLEGAEDTLALPTLAAADSAISRLANYDLCPVSRLQSGEEYQLVLQIAVRPLASGDRKHLFRFASHGGDADDAGITFDLNRIFGHALEEEEGSRQIIGRASPFFRAGDLKEAP
jgi:hypothetical protein